MASIRVPDIQNDELDPSALLGTLLDRKWLIGAVTAICLIVSALYAVFATPIYQANGLVQVEQKPSALPGLAELSQTLGAASSGASTEIAIIKSRLVIGAAVRELGLDVVVTPHRFPLIGDYMARRYQPAQPGDVARPWLGMAGDDWGGSELKVFALDVPTDLEGVTLTLVAGNGGTYTLERDGTELLRGKVGEVATGHGITLQVSALRGNPGMRFSIVRNRTLRTILGLQPAIGATEEGQNSGIIKLTYDNADPARAVAVLNQVQRAYVAQNVENNAEQAANSLKFVKQQLPGARQQLEKAQTALNLFQLRAHSVDLTMQTQALLNQVVAVDGGIQQLQLQEAEVERKFTPAHPEFKALMQQIGALQAQKAKLQEKIDELPDTQKELLQLTEDVKISNTTYTGLLNVAQQLEIARAGTVGSVRIVDAAATDVSHPVAPRRALIVLVATLLGACLSIAYVLLVKSLAKGVEDPSQLEQLGLPVYAAVPMSARELEILPAGRHARFHGDGTQRLLAVDSPSDLAVEALRSLRTSLHFARTGARNNVLMVSGSGPQAGKTFVSANLAAVMAQGGQRVVLIDADLRKGTTHRVLGQHAGPGLSELISGQAKIDDVMRAVPGVENLHFIGRGKVPPNPSELLMGPALEDLFADLSAAYDLVIVDTPPILAVTDAALIGQHAGISLLVARFGISQKRAVALAKQRFEQSGVKISGVVFNAVEKRSSGYYSYGYYEYKPARG